MGRHDNPDKPTDSGSGGSGGTDGSRPNDHGTEGFPSPSQDGQRPT